MPSALPTESTLDKAVNVFGIGTYDSQRDSDGEHGEDSERKEPEGKSLPEDLTKSPQTEDPFEHNRLLSYPDDADARLGAVINGTVYIAVADLPGIADRDVTHQHPKTEIYDARVESSAQDSKLPAGGVEGRDPGAHAELPSDADNPPARSDYYDRMVTGQQEKTAWSGFEIPKEDSGAYVSQEKVSDSALPTVNKDEESMDDWAQALGNWWSGYEIEDISGRQGFPSTDFAENVDFDKSDQDNGGRVLPLGDGRMLASGGVSMQSKTATDIKLVPAMTTEFLREYGRKDLTKRHVLAYLQKKGRPQYLSSDIIRCLKLNHDIHVKDVLDEFPVTRKASAASQTTIAALRDKFIQIECDNVLDERLSTEMRRCAANMTRAIVDMEKLERGNNG